MAKYKHLCLQDRIDIQINLDKGFNFREIALEIGKDASTISKEVRRHLYQRETGTGGLAYNPCAKAKGCRIQHACARTCYKFCHICGKCVKYCKQFVPHVCKRLVNPPYCCNGCPRVKKCYGTKMFYVAASAHRDYKEHLKETRKGFLIAEAEAIRINNVLVPLIKKGHSIHHICVNHKDELMLSEKTMYTYIDGGLFNVRNIDLPRKVRYRQRKKPVEFKVDRKCRIGRTYEDYITFLKDNNEPAVAQMDTVKGNISGKVLLTIHFVNVGFMLAFLREANTARSVTDIFDELYSKLGRELFMRLFPVILTDNGSEFSNPTKIEFDSNGERRTNVFYCDRNRSDQKGNIEVNHEFIRRITPQGESFNLRTQDDINLMMSHINSYKRKRLNDQCPHTAFNLFYGSNIAEKLNIQLISPDEINLTPSIFYK
jgi:IS30 family transposase